MSDSLVTRDWNMTGSAIFAATNILFWYYDRYRCHGDKFIFDTEIHSFFNSIEIFIWFTQFKVLRSEIADGKWNTINQFIIRIHFRFVYSFERKKERIAHIENEIAKHVYDVRTDADDTFFFGFHAMLSKIKGNKQINIGSRCLLGPKE